MPCLASPPLDWGVAYDHRLWIFRNSSIFRDMHMRPDRHTGSAVNRREALISGLTLLIDGVSYLLEDDTLSSFSSSVNAANRQLD